MSKIRIARSNRRFEALIEPHLDALFRAAFRLARHTSDAEDLVQDTCVRAFERIDRLESDGPVRAWLLKVMHNLFVDGVRRSRLAPVVGVDDEHPASAYPGPGPQDSLCDAERADGLEQAWQKLEADQRALLALRAEGYTLPEIGAITGLTTEVLNARLYRARRSFARFLAQEPAVAHRTRMEMTK